MSEYDSDDSDQQGFIPYQLQIKASPFPVQDKEKSGFNVFEPHYILGTTMLTKEPPQYYQRCLDIPQQMYSIKDDPPLKDADEEKLSAFHTYSFTNQYRCVYSRYKDPLKNGGKLTFGTSKVIVENQLILKDSPHKHYQMTRCLRSWNENNINCEHSQDLVFDSKFEGGNLLSAFRSLNEPKTYILFMQNDTNTYGYNQWFYFSIRNIKPNEVYTFRISNFKKKYSFFKRGMQPVLFSLERARRTGNGWSRAGFNIRYYMSNFTEVDCSPYYTLEFQVSFEFQKDYVTFSPSPPYSYSRLMNLIKRCSEEAVKNQMGLKLQSASKSLGGNQVPYLIMHGQGEYKINKPSIVIFGRQHSGEIWSSYLIQELLNQIIFERSQGGKWLLGNYNFHIFPMINVDGVIYGNFRCDIAGYDLNRCWKTPSSLIHPQIYKIKQILQDLSEASSIDYCLDMHTHSKQCGIFAYCCADNQTSRYFPLLLSKITNLFRYRACTFGISKDKKQTARASLFQISKSSNIITIQMSSFGVKRKNSNMGDVFQVKSIKTFANSLIEALYYKQSANQQIIDKLNSKQDEQILEDDYPVSGSDSDPQADQLSVEIKIKKIFPKSSLKQFSSPLNLRKKKKASKQLGFKKTPKMKTDNDSLTSPDVSIIKVKSRYNEPFIYQKKDFFQTQSEKGPSQISQARETHSSKLNKSVNFSSRNAVPYKTVKSNFFDKKPQIQKQLTPLNMFQFSLKKLPIFGGDFLSQNSQLLSHQNHSLMMTTMNMTRYKESSQHGVEKGLQKMNTSSEQRTKKEQHKGRKGEFRNVPFPYLCIMSESKKNEHIQRLQESKQEKKSKFMSECNRTQTIFKKEALKDGILTRLVKQRNLNSEAIQNRMIDNFKKFQTKRLHNQ